MPVIDQEVTSRYALYRGDCVQVLKDIPDGSVGHTIFSPPFVALYSYSDSDKDMGNCKDYNEFFIHFGFLVDALRRVMMPGRIVAVHCMDLPTFKNQGDPIGFKDFPGHIIRCFEDAGFVYHCPRITVWKDPLIAATRTHALGLSHQQIVKDSAMCHTGAPDFVLAFRNAGENPKPILHPKGLTEYPGKTPVPRELDKYLNWQDQVTNKRSHWIWQRIASPVWTDIRQTKVLPYQEGRDKDDQRHICPLQVDLIRRCLILWSNLGDVVLDPFCGVGSVPYCAVDYGRKGLGIELKKSYFRQSVRNLKALHSKQKAAKGFGI